VKPRFLDSVESVLSVHGDRLRNLVGCQLTDANIVWDVNDKSWFADEPVLLIFGDHQLEIVFWQLNELAINWNTINLNASPNWFGCYGDMELEWRDCDHPAVTGAIGRHVTELVLIECHFETEVLQDRQNPANVGNRHASWLLHALQLQFDNAILTVFNALDENGLSTDRLDGDGFRQTQLSAA
jgi:hypothetical protein